MFIKVSVVLAGAESCILRLDEEEWGGLRGLGFSNFARFKMFVDELLACFHLFWVHQVAFSHLWHKGLL